MADAPPDLPTHRRAWAAAIAAFLIHNVEEVALDLPAWSDQHTVLPWLDWMVSPGVFATAVGVLSFVMGGIALYAMATEPRWSRTVLIVFSLVMLANAASHLALSVLTSRLMPGAMTAGLVLLPVLGGVLWTIRR